MPFITQGKANIKYLLIVVLVAAVAGGIIFAASNSFYKDIVNLNNFNEIKKPEKNIKSGTTNVSTPSDYVFLKSIPLNFSTTESINVYSRCLNGYYDPPYCGGDQELMLEKNNTTDKSNISIGKIVEVSLTGNSGGLFVPVAITKDNKKIILSAEMGLPGAGGGGTDYGFAIASIPEKESTEELASNIIATRSSIFYDYYSKVVFVDEGNKTPHFWQPGPSNDGMIAYRDLSKDTYKVILEEDFTSYEIAKVDEKNNTLELKATKYTIPTGCSAGIENNEWGNIPDCVIKKTTTRTIGLPI